MSERRFEQSMNPKEHIQSELEDAGVSHPSEWREALDLETPLKGEEGFEGDRRTEETRETKTEIQAGVIENGHWQRQLDVAFEHGDFALIKTLQRVRPDNFPNPELVRSKLNELVVLRQSRWEKTYRAIREISGVEPDATVVEAEFAKLFEQFGQEKGILDQLKSFKRATGYNPSAETVQTKCRNIFAGKKSYSFETEDLIKDIKTLTGIQPDKTIFQEMMDKGDIRQAKKLAPIFGLEVTSEMIQQAYEAQFAKNGYLDTYGMSEIGEKPNADLVGRIYQRILEKRGDRWVDSIKSLEQVTGIKPSFTEEQMRPIFEEFLQHGWYGQLGYVGIEHLTEMTGMKPPADLVEKAALKIVDGGHGYIDQGKSITEGLKRFKEGVGVDFEIPESEIQARYQKAVADKKAHVINNLYGAFGIRPQIDKEEARQFMVSLMDDTYHNPIAELEKTFDIKFKATKEEIESKQDQNIEKLSFDGLAKIKELTGKDCDPKKLEAALIKWLEKEAVVTSEKRGDYNRDWEKPIKQRLEQFNVTIPPEVAINIYTSLIQNETAHSSNLIKTYQLTGVPIPAELAQQAYRKYLSADYAYSIKTGQGSSRSLGSVSGAFEELFKASGIRPEISNDELQSFYRSSLEEDSWYGRGGKHNIEKLAEITGIKPEFDPQDINRLYKQWILSGREDRIRNVKEITGIELQLDEETAVFISQQIEAGIDKVRSTDYEKEEEYREKKFDTYSLEQDLRKVSSLTTATGVKPNAETLQLAYSEILANDPYWATKIEQIVKATGVQPVFNPEQLQAKGEQLLEKGAFRSFERLQAYGQFTFTPDIAEKAYSGLIATSRRYDDYDRRYYYNEDWVSRIKRFQEMSGVRPNEAQLAQIFSHISQDGRIARSRYGDDVDGAIKFFAENLQTEITPGMVKDIALSYLSRGDANRMKRFIEKTGVTPDLSDEDLLPHTSRLLEAKELNTLAYLRQELKLGKLPVSDEAAQNEYQHFASQEDFGKESSKSFAAFKQIFELTGIPANFPPEQVDRSFKSTRFSEWQKLSEVTGTLPSAEIVQYKYLQFFTGGHYGLDKNIEAIRALTGQSPDSETIGKALDHLASEGKIEEMTNIVKIVGGQASINPESGQKAYRKVTEQFNSNSSIYWGEKLVGAINFLNDILGIRPDNETMYQIYSKTFGQTDYKNAHEGPGGQRVYPQFWEFLIKKFGKPTPDVVQRIYLDQLAA